MTGAGTSTGGAAGPGSGPSTGDGAGPGTGTEDEAPADPDEDPGPGATAPPSAPPPPPLAASRRAGAITAAVVPGVLARGLGSYVARRPRAARRLLVVGGIGLASAIAGGLPLYATYGSGKVVVPGVHFAVGGTGLVLASWWTDIYAAAGGDRLGGRPRALPPLAFELTATWQHDAYLGERALLAPAAELRRGRWTVRAAGLVALAAGTGGGRVDLEVRPWAPRSHDIPDVAGARHNGTAVGLRTAVQYHAEPTQNFALLTAELAVRGRLDLERLDPHLRGSFLELDEGLGLEVVDYAHATPEVNTILLSRFAWGLYLPGGRGEVSVFYDHRRDQLAGGLPAGRAAGFLGSIGADLQLSAGRRWLALARVEIGSSALTTLGLRRELP
jgi:hypothetical protein